MQHALCCFSRFDLLNSQGFLYTKVRVSEAVAKRFSAFVETADELDQALAPLGGGHGVAMVPNDTGKEVRGGKQPRSESPFVDILGDGDEDEEDRFYEGEGSSAERLCRLRRCFRCSIQSRA